MSNLHSAVAFWVNQYNASQATLATRTSERDSARNSLYVSGVFGSGATWQAQDATDVANYNAMVTDRNTWQGRANNAWGASRVWNSGTSFETDSASNAALAAARLPAGSGSTPNVTTGALSTTTPGSGAVWSGSSLTAPLTGHYVGYWFHQPNSTNTGQFTMYLRKAGVQQGAAFSYNAVNGSQATYAGAVEFDATAGQTIDLFCAGFSGSNGSSVSGSFKIVFVPTPNNPH